MNQDEIGLDPFYLNQRRVAGLVGSVATRAALSAEQPRMTYKMLANVELATMTDLLQQWMDSRREPLLPFEALWARGTIKTQDMFTVYRDFYCRGIRSWRKNGRPKMYAEFRDLGPAGDTVRLNLLINLSHVAPGSPGDLLTGRAQSLFIVAVTNRVRMRTVDAVPNFVGRLATRGALTKWLHANQLELHVDSIDSFQAVRQVPRGTSLSPLKSIPEQDVKEAFAKIIGEPDVQKDWGGERSDLFTPLVQVEGKRVSTAFIFKGPSQFKPMTIASLGKNGDQIDRAFSEPAELIVLQHCHRVTSPVRSMLRAYCNQYGRRRRYCIIDGYDTLRVLQAYGKCRT